MKVLCGEPSSSLPSISQSKPSNPENGKTVKTVIQVKSKKSDYGKYNDFNDDRNIAYFFNCNGDNFFLISNNTVIFLP